MATCRARQASAPEAGSGAAAASPGSAAAVAPGPSVASHGGGLEHDDVDLRDRDRFGVGLARRARRRIVSGSASPGAAVWPARMRANNESTSASSVGASTFPAPRSAVASGFAVASGEHDFEHLRLGLRDGDLARDVVAARARARALGRGARFDMGERLGRVEERALHHAVRLEQTVAALTQLFDLCLQQAATAAEIGEHAFARDARFVEHLAALRTRALDDRTGFLLRALTLVIGGPVARGADLRPARLGLADDLGRGGFGLAGAHRQDLRRLRAETMRLRLRLFHHARGALLGLAADVVRCLARRPQQTRGFLAERVEQLLLVERARRPKLLLEVVEGLPELLLAFARRGQLFGDAPEERADFRFRVSAK